VAQDNVEAVRGFYEAADRGDVDCAMVVFAEDGEWHQVTPVPDRATFRGRDEIRAFLTELVEAFAPRIEIRMLVDATDHVAVVGGLHAITGIGLQIEFALVHVWRFRDGEAVWVYDCAGPDRGP
jgi:ketosteroid isomerase-like protein